MKIKKVVKRVLITLIVFALVLSGLYLFLYNHGLSGRMLVPEPATEDQVKVACVGDSITYGHGIKDWTKNNYPVLLQNKLGESYHVQSFGVSGRAVQDNSDQPYRALKFYTQSMEYHADIVVFMMGSNDSKPENWFGADAFKTSLCTLLDSYTDSKIILCTPPACFFMEKHTGTTTSHDLQPAVAAEIAEIVREIATERNYPLVDIYELTEANPQWFEADGVHPNNDGAAAIAEEVYKAVLAIEVKE